MVLHRTTFEIKSSFEIKIFISKLDFISKVVLTERDFEVHCYKRNVPVSRFNGFCLSIVKFDLRHSLYFVSVWTSQKFCNLVKVLDTVTINRTTATIPRDDGLLSEPTTEVNGNDP